MCEISQLKFEEKVRYHHVTVFGIFIIYFSEALERQKERTL